jgi:hypothetical protein
MPVRTARADDMWAPVWAPWTLLLPPIAGAFFSPCMDWALLFLCVLCGVLMRVRHWRQDPVDAKPAIEEDCAHHHCAPLQKLLDKCTARVQNTPGTTEQCTQELFDLMHCIDHCVRGSPPRSTTTRAPLPTDPPYRDGCVTGQAAPKIFATLK